MLCSLGEDDSQATTVCVPSPVRQQIQLPSLFNQPATNIHYEKQQSRMMQSLELEEKLL